MTIGMFSLGFLAAAITLGVLAYLCEENASDGERNILLYAILLALVSIALK